MKHFLVVLLALAFVLTPGMTQAAPFDTGFMQWSQPDNTTFVARAWGDEFFWWMETDDGYRIVQGSGDWFYYATLDERGEFTPTSKRVGIDDPPPQSYQLDRSAARIAEIQQQVAQATAQIALNAQWFADKQAENPGAPVVLRIGVIFVEFQDVRRYQGGTRPLGYLKADFDSMMFSQNYWYAPAESLQYNSPHPEEDRLYGSFRDYWYQMSRGKFIVEQGPPINPVDTNGVPRWILLDHPRSHYMNTPLAIFPEAIQKAIDSAWLDTTAYDKYAVIFARDAPGQVGVLVHGHAVGGRYFQVPERHGVRLNSPSLTAFAHIGTYAHEFGHNLGFRDQYVGTDPEMGNTDLYNFDLMAWGIYNGPHYKGACPATLSPFYRIDKGWISSTPLPSDTTNFVVQYDYNNPKIYKITPVGAASDEHYLIETKLRYGFDLYIPTSPDSFVYQPGTLLVWHNNVVGACGYVDRIRLKHADNTRAWGSFLTDFFPSNPSTNSQNLNDISIPAATIGSPYLLEPWKPDCDNERPAHFVLNGIHKLPNGNTLIDTVNTRHAMVSTTVRRGRNMLGVPANVPNFSVSAVYPTATSPALAWVPDSGYVVRTMLELGKGYFIRFGATENIVLAGGLVDSLPIPVNAQWNLLGSISDQIPISNICVYPYPANRITSLIFKYLSGRGYVAVNSIKAGLGHWVKLQQAGTLVMKRFPSSCRPVRTIEFAELDHFQITDANGEMQDVYVANIDRASSLDDLDLSMPPPFPDAEFDARFEGGDFVKTVSADSGVVELVINVETQAYPVTVSWDLNPENGIEYSIITEGMGKQQSFNRLAQSGSAVMTTAAGGKFRMNAQATGRVTSNIPSQYLLAQNYPNPFNPETRIHFELPQDGHVRLVVYDLLGREVATLVNEFKKAGRYEVAFNATNLASGVYFYRLSAVPTARRDLVLKDGQAGRFHDVKKLVILR